MKRLRLKRACDGTARVFVGLAMVACLVVLASCDHPAGDGANPGQPSSTTQRAAAPTPIPDSAVSIMGLVEKGQFAGVKVTRVTPTELYFTTPDGTFGVRMIAEIPRIMLKGNAGFNKAEELFAADRFADAAAAYKAVLARQGEGDLKSLVQARLALAERFSSKLQPQTKPGPLPVEPPVAAASKTKSLDLGGGVAMKLVLIPSGKFLMGSPDTEANRDDAEGPQHEVTISKPFYMGTCPVTRAQFAQFISDSGYKTQAESEGWSNGWNGSTWGRLDGKFWNSPGFDQDGDHPVVCVTYSDCLEFCKWLEKKTGDTVSLPTEARWEYACRAGTKTAYPWGDDADLGKGWCNADDQMALKTLNDTDGSHFTWDDGYAYTSPVGKFKANAFGLYDMPGNVWVWCSDWYSDSYKEAGQMDPVGPASGSSRVLRGGGWFGYPKGCRSAFRLAIEPATRGWDLGFRVTVEAK